MEQMAICNPAKGRPREFDVDVALAAALRVFWRRGYEGASMAELTSEMGITKPSLYAAFGNKEALFKKALDLYQQEKMAFVGEALARPTARGVAETFLRGVVRLTASRCDPCGCLGVVNSTACGTEAEPIREEVKRRSAESKAAMLARLDRAKADGDLPQGVEPEALANFIYAVSQGISLQAGNGATAEELNALVDTTLALWPSL